MSDARLALEYVLPVRRADRVGEDEFAAYLLRLSMWADVTVVDGSARALFDALARRLQGSAVRHVVPAVPGSNGKASGAMTGLRLARHDCVVIADDDVRYTRADLEAVLARLNSADAVRVQNVTRPSPWHARWDTGRILVNRALGGDYGGTLAVRAGIVLRHGGYRTDVLFENLELERTIRAEGGTVDVPLSLLVHRLPPTLPHFLGQRVRQAYDGFAQPPRLLAELAFLPLTVFAVVQRRAAAVVCVLLLVAGLAEVGRRRAGGARHFRRFAAAWAPLWALERGVTSWIAVACRLRGGVRYGSGRLRVAASPPRRLRAAAVRRGREEAVRDR